MNQAVRFNSSDKKEKQFVMDLRKRVNDYFKSNQISPKANTAMVFKTIILINSYLLPFLAILLIPMNIWIAGLSCIIMGFGIAGIGMGVMHDACHGAYSRRNWVNHLLAGSLYLLGSNVLNWKIQHNVLHHTYTNLSGLDEDIDDKGPIRLSENKPVKWFHRYQFIYAFAFYGLMTLTMLTNDFTRLYKYHKAGLVKSQNKKMGIEFTKMMARKIIYLAAIFGLPLWLTDYTWWQILIGFFVMHWTASIILSFVFQMAHVVEGAEQPVTDPLIPTEWSVHQLHTTSDFARNNKFISWYVGGLNFQIEHHLFPNICHIHYSKLAPIVEQTAREYGIHYNLKPSFRSALLSHIYRLKELGKIKKIGSSLT
ncbi:MAG: acyl-CoA desaturase [Bacteroidota bacterium]|jgi:linoleoyl-CoA desaturase|nr:acyl-CoA desaturase [Bacteroidota bacterium]